MDSRILSEPASLRALLNQQNEWQLGPEQEKVGKHLKDIIATEPLLQYFDASRLIQLSSDASKGGLGAVIMQLHNNEWKLVAYASRTVTQAETRYAQVEKELLGIVFACEQFHLFVHGAMVQAEADHKPLIAIFKKSLNDCLLRVQRLLLRVQRYDLDVVYTPGKVLVAADMLSRAPEKIVTANDQPLEDVVKMYADMMIKTMPVFDKRLDQIRNEKLADDEMVILKDVIVQGWPEKQNQCPSESRPYWNIRGKLTVVEEVLYKGSKIVIPKWLRKDMLLKIREAHLDIEK